jgi:hypothetical protein
MIFLLLISYNFIKLNINQLFKNKKKKINFKIKKKEYKKNNT